MKKIKLKFFLFVIFSNILVHLWLRKSWAIQADTEKLNFSYIKSYPWMQRCNLKTNFIPPYKPSKQTPYDYSSPSPNSTFNIRITKAVIIYFPLDLYDFYANELAWLYRSWIEILKTEPSKWRTDLVIFVHMTNEQLKKFDIFQKLNCSFDNTVADYPNADSVLIAFDGYEFLKESGYNFVIRSDIDVFLTPLFAKWSPRHCNAFYVGGGAYTANFNMNRLKRAGHHINFKYGFHANLGSTWYSTPDQFRLVSYLTLFSMAYLANEEFSPPERNGDLGALLWPHWHYWVLSLYGQNLAMNHLIETKQLNIIQLSDLLDYPANENKHINSVLHIHNWCRDKFLVLTYFFNLISLSIDHKLQIANGTVGAVMFCFFLQQLSIADGLKNIPLCILEFSTNIFSTFIYKNIATVKDFVMCFIKHREGDKKISNMI
ncbi:secreted protein [Brachionus plicatilis]|uniref:Secreted protein n=1 Tax=Brachionus plicatilis TaxID=10195 RepID=A0A3M7S9U1_BRAPC|nr:secreted protein [Brachionus plicatilis]